MKRQLLALIGGVLLFGTAAVTAQQRTAEDEQGLNNALEIWVRAYNEHDAKALAQEYTEDADVMFPSGEKVKGREAVEKGFAASFSKNPNVRTRLSDVTRTSLTPDIVIEDGTWEESGLSDPSAPTKGYYTSVLVRRNGKWLVVHERGWVASKEAK
jgi:uncharacterized protein (TIGR02246 family)